MPSQQNIQAVKELESKLDTSNAVYLADYSGLSAKEQVELRAKVKQAGGDIIIAKNRLLKIALKNKGHQVDKIEGELTGPNLTLLTNNDAVSPLKALVEFAKDHESNKPTLKSGILESEILPLDKLKYLASLPSKTELIGKLLGTLTNPARNLVGVLSAPTRDLVYALNAIKDNKSAN